MGGIGGHYMLFNRVRETHTHSHTRTRKRTHIQSPLRSVGWSVPPVAAGCNVNYGQHSGTDCRSRSSRFNVLCVLRASGICAVLLMIMSKLCEFVCACDAMRCVHALACCCPFAQNVRVHTGAIQNPLQITDAKLSNDQASRKLIKAL